MNTKKSNPPEKQQVIQLMGLAWYKAENYARLRSMFTDGDKLPLTFEEWAKGAENGVNDLRGKGYTVVKVNIDPDSFPAWCASRGMEINSRARLRFARESAIREYKNQG